jgi:hypothetical protein
VKSIFLSLSIVANSALAVAAWLGWSIDPAAPDPLELRSAISGHLLTALGASLLVLLLHAVVLTYFMGTGRWIEETTAAYQLGEARRKQNVQLKYQVLPWMVLVMLLVIGTAAAGAMSDPLQSGSTPTASSVHLGLAVSTLILNLLLSTVQHRAIARNGVLVQEIVDEVRRIRRERGLE